MARSAKQQAADFITANDKSPVVSGYAIESNPHKPSKGAVYRLKDGSKHRLGVEACALVTGEYPKWDL